MVDMGIILSSFEASLVQSKNMNVMVGALSQLMVNNELVQK